MPVRSGKTGHIAWYAHGDNPEILLLHGFSDSAACWDPLVGRFGADVLTLDARGHGESEMPDEAVSADRQAADAAAVLDDLKLGPVVVVGHSMGAANAAALGRARPDLVRALVLEDPPRGDRPAQQRRPFPDALAATRAQDVPTRVAKGKAAHPKWPDDEFEGWAISKGQLSGRIFEVPVEAAIPLTEVLGSITCPVLLIHGDPDQGGLISSDYAVECAQAAAGKLTAVHIPGVGHNVRREDRAAYLSAVSAFLGEVSSLSP
jgi:pimeloyl-ACP methyl ester carboxylesterase